MERKKYLFGIRETSEAVNQGEAEQRMKQVYSLYSAQDCSSLSLVQHRSDPLVLENILYYYNNMSMVMVNLSIYRQVMDR